MLNAQTRICAGEWGTHNYFEIQTDHLLPARRPDFVITKLSLIEGDLKATFSIAIHWGVTPFPELFYFTLDPYLIMLSVKQDGIKYHFFSLWDDLTWDWTPVFQTIGELSVRQWSGSLIRPIVQLVITKKKENLLNGGLCHRVKIK